MVFTRDAKERISVKKANERLWLSKKRNGVVTLVLPATKSEYHHHTPPFLVGMDHVVPSFITFFSM
jgi:hypothetical protein